MANCEPLILNVKAKLNSWSARSLSFAGRLLLINTVISGITNFWCATFTLPKFCIKLINSLCGAYLWKGTVEGHHSARVAWDQITHAKEEGGLGVRDLLSWNKGASINQAYMDVVLLFRVHLGRLVYRHCVIGQRFKLLDHQRKQKPHMVSQKTSALKANCKSLDLH